jgi:phosphate transport system substrate-binding protein
VRTIPRPNRRRRRTIRLGAASLTGGLALALGATSVASAVSAPGGSLSKNLIKTPTASLTGLGASSVQPFYGRVLYQYGLLNKKVAVSYSPGGSGPGVTAIEQGTVAFGQSEIPMSAAQQAAAKGPVLQVPVDLGGVAISYHVHGISSGLKLDGPTLVKIYLRQITTWNDPAIARLNPTLHLPNENIVPVFRSDTSGPGYDLDQYLIDTDPTWATAAAGKASTTWPTAGRASGDSGEQLNSGVASYIKQAEGSIGYVEYAYASLSKFTNAALLSKSNTYVAPSITTIRNAGADAKNVTAANFNIVWSPGTSTYPLANFSWALIDQKQATTNTGIVLGKLFEWVTTKGQSYSASLGYAPLPTSIVTLDRRTLRQLQTATGQSIFSG